MQIPEDAPVVLVDDDSAYGEVLALDLRDRGFAVRVFSDGQAFLLAMQDDLNPAVVLLDWTMPGMPGIEVLRRLREKGCDKPAVFLTGRSPVEREIEALRAGAVDFIDKARGTAVLAHRLRVLIDCAAIEAGKANAIHHGSLVLYGNSARAVWRGTDVGLTVTEYKVIASMVGRPGEYVTYRAIYDQVHFNGFVAGQDGQGHRVNVRAMIRRIRRKFQVIDPAFNEITAMTSVGYRWGGLTSGGSDSCRP